MIQYINKDIQAFLQEELRKYEVTIGDMTVEERMELRKWVADGNSPYENPCLLCEENGCPMDYIHAARITEDMRNNPDDYKFSSEAGFIVSESETPFNGLDCTAAVKCLS